MTETMKYLRSLTHDSNWRLLSIKKSQNNVSFNAFSFARGHINNLFWIRTNKCTEAQEIYEHESYQQVY
jgi:hypothetical protein